MKRHQQTSTRRYSDRLKSGARLKRPLSNCPVKLAASLPKWSRANRQTSARPNLPFDQMPPCPNRVRWHFCVYASHSLCRAPLRAEPPAALNIPAGRRLRAEPPAASNPPLRAEKLAVTFAQKKIGLPIRHFGVSKPTHFESDDRKTTP